MNFGNSNSDSTPQPRIPIDLQNHCVTGIMEMMTSRNRVSPPPSYSSSSGSIPAPHHLRPEVEKKRFVYDQRSQIGNSSSNPSRSRMLPSGYFSLESLFLLIGLTASLHILPLILPPLPPPPFLLLLIPIGIMVLLMFLAFTPSARDMTYTSL
ncbi:unnamed protein product [Linum trigynum]|uniref:ARGOS-like protein n=1 Tax=Linum trigynum TaxID=586398 RepID=A0AAV2C8Z3_9ROSI